MKAGIAHPGFQIKPHGGNTAALARPGAQGQFRVVCPVDAARPHDLTDDSWLPGNVADPAKQMKVELVSYPVPENETERLAALRALDILDSPQDARFNDITRAAKHALNADMALITFVDTDRVWLKSACGFDGKEIARDVSFCSHTIAQAEPLVVKNASLDPRFRDNPLVKDAPFLRFYAGSPMVVQGQSAVGVFCVLGFEPRFRFSQDDVDLLKFFASVSLDRLLEHAARSRQRAA